MWEHCCCNPLHLEWVLKKKHRAKDCAITRRRAEAHSQAGRRGVQKRWEAVRTEARLQELYHRPGM